MKYLIGIIAGMMVVITMIVGTVDDREQRETVKRLNGSLLNRNQTIARQDSTIAELVNGSPLFQKLKPGYACYINSDSTAYMFNDKDCGLIVVWTRYANPFNAPIPLEWIDDGKPRPRYTKGRKP